MLLREIPERLKRGFCEKGLDCVTRGENAAADKCWRRPCVWEACG